MGLGSSRESHFSMLKRAEHVLTNPAATNAQIEAAAELCNAAIDECPAYPLGYMVLGKLRMRLGQYREAAEATTQCLDRQPDLYSLYFMLADCLEACDEYEAAMAALANVPKARRADLRAVHERRKMFLAESRPAADATAHPLVPSHSTAVGDGTAGDVELEVQRPNSAGGLSRSSDGDSCSPPLAPPLGAATISRRPPPQPHTVTPQPPVGPATLDDQAIDEWYRNRQDEFYCAMQRDANHIKFRRGERKQYARSAIDRTKMQRIGEHRERFNRLSAESLHRR